jgi:hypothetical protein
MKTIAFNYEIKLFFKTLIKAKPCGYFTVSLYIDYCTLL